MVTEKNIIRDIVQAYRQTRVEGNQFFISWNGVPTMAYKGFSPVLLDIKKEITSRLSCIRKENPGSMWPKTTLGALNDDKTLSLDDLNLLRDICDEMNPAVCNQIFHIHTLEIVLFYCRSLEQRIVTESIPLAGPEDVSPPPGNHLNEVAAIMNQFSRHGLSSYLVNVQKPGHRESHYRLPFIEATLVYDLGKVPAAITGFREEVDRKLPGKYCWFDDKSLHITVRALV